MAAAAAERGDCVVLLYYKTMARMADKIVQSLSEMRRQSGGVWRSCEKRDVIKWDSFEDGFPNIFINDVRSLAGRDVLFLAAMESSSTIFEQCALIYSLPRYLVKSLTIILPYFPTGTMERVDEEGQIATAKTLAVQLSSTPLARGGPAQLVIFDIHALQERFYFDTNIIPRLESAVPLLLSRLEAIPSADRAVTSIVFPDDGAFKRFHNAFKGYEHVICAKIRDGDKRIITIKEGTVSGRHLVIVDDLIKTGRTLIECINAMHAHGALSVSAFVTHPVFPNRAYEAFKPDMLRHFWVTDSCPTVAHELEGRAPFEVLSLAPRIAKMCIDFDLCL